MYCRNYSEPDPDLEIRGVGAGLSLVRSLRYKSLAKVFSYVGDFVAASDRLLLAAPDIISSKTHNEVSFELCWNLLGLTRMKRDGREDGKKVAVENSEYNLVPDSQLVASRCLRVLYARFFFKGAGGGGERRFKIGVRLRHTGSKSLRAPQPNPNFFSQNTQVTNM